MTGTFDFIRQVIKLASDEKIEKILQEVFLFAASKVVDDELSFKNWSISEYGMVEEGEPDMNIWNEYFDDIHDLDHVTHHKAFTGAGYRIINQLRLMLDVGLFHKNRLRTLFKVSEAAKIWFHENFEHMGYGLWKRRE